MNSLVQLRQDTTVLDPLQPAGRPGADAEDSSFTGGSDA